MSIIQRRDRDFQQRSNARLDHGGALRNRHCALIAKIAEIRAPRIWLEPDPQDLRDIGEYVDAVLGAIEEWHGDVAREAGMDGAGNVDEMIKEAVAQFSDLKSNFRGAMGSAADELEEAEDIP